MPYGFLKNGHLKEELCFGLPYSPHFQELNAQCLLFRVTDFAFQLMLCLSSRAIADRSQGRLYATKGCIPIHWRPMYIGG